MRTALPGGFAPSPLGGRCITSTIHGRRACGSGLCTGGAARGPRLPLGRRRRVVDGWRPHRLRERADGRDLRARLPGPAARARRCGGDFARGRPRRQRTTSRGPRDGGASWSLLPAAPAGVPLGRDVGRRRHGARGGALLGRRREHRRRARPGSDSATGRPQHRRLREADRVLGRRRERRVHISSGRAGRPRRCVDGRCRWASSHSSLMRIGGYGSRSTRARTRCSSPKAGLTKGDLVALLPRRRRLRAAPPPPPAVPHEALPERRRGRVLPPEARAATHPDYVGEQFVSVPERALHRCSRSSTTRPRSRGWSTSAASSCTPGTRAMRRHRAARLPADRPRPERAAASGATSARSRSSSSEVMDELGLASYPKTSGATGLHILAPIKPELPFPEVRRFAKALAEEVERRVGDQDVATTTWRVADRRGVFVDFGQNARSRTIASAYSIRPTADAPPRRRWRWKEVAALGSGQIHAPDDAQAGRQGRRPHRRDVAAQGQPPAALRAARASARRPAIGGSNGAPLARRWAERPSALSDANAEQRYGGDEDADCSQGREGPADAGIDRSTGPEQRPAHEA